MFHGFSILFFFSFLTLFAVPSILFGCCPGVGGYSGLKVVISSPFLFNFFFLRIFVERFH